MTKLQYIKMTTTISKLTEILETWKDYLIYPEDRIKSVKIHMIDFASYATKYNESLRNIRKLYKELKLMTTLNFFNSIKFKYLVNKNVSTFQIYRKCMIDEFSNEKTDNFIQKSIIKQSNISFKKLLCFLNIKKYKNNYFMVDDKTNNIIKTEEINETNIINLLPRPLIIKIGEPLSLDNSVLKLDSSDILSLENSEINK
jgi:hypothetical protein